jgi:mannose-6-phosphate isomerase-like protein (cupin superfamily)
VLYLDNFDGKSSLGYLLPTDGEAPFEASWWSIDPGHTSFPDQHLATELWIIGQGSGRLTLGTDEIDITAGQAIYIPSDVEHIVTSTGTVALVGYSITWERPVE